MSRTHNPVTIVTVKHASRVLRDNAVTMVTGNCSKRGHHSPITMETDAHRKCDTPTCNSHYGWYLLVRVYNLGNVMYMYVQK